jgi:hypothetical protein
LFVRYLYPTLPRRLLHPHQKRRSKEVVGFYNSRRQSVGIWFSPFRNEDGVVTTDRKIDGQFLTRRIKSI